MPETCSVSVTWRLPTPTSSYTTACFSTSTRSSRTSTSIVRSAPASIGRSLGWRSTGCRLSLRVGTRGWLSRPARRAVHPVNPPVLVLELDQRIEDSDGVPYVVRVLGRERIDGTWAACLEFVRVGASLVRRTRVETTQRSREAVAHWASGLEPVYLQGALARTGRHMSGATIAAP